MNYALKTLLIVLTLSSVSGCSKEIMEQGRDIVCQEAAQQENVFLTCMKSNTPAMDKNFQASVTHAASVAAKACLPVYKPYLRAETRCIRHDSYVPGKGPKLSQSEALRKARTVINIKAANAVCACSKNK